MKNNYEEQIIEFVSFCIENFKVVYKMPGKEVANLFNEKGVIEFLISDYDILHTQGKEYILEQIARFLEKRGYDI